MNPDWLDSVLAFVAANKSWGALVIGLLAFGESLAFIGILVPATTVLFAAGALVGAGVLPFWEIWVGGAVGASLGDAVSYWIGRRIGPRIEHMWPFKTRPHWLAAGERVFQRWGWAAVFVGRFIGPLRATVPLAAGILEMPHWPFQFVNVVSAIVWIPVLVFPGAVAAWSFELARGGNTWEAVALGLGLLVVAGGGWLLFRRQMPRLMGGRDEAK